MQLAPAVVEAHKTGGAAKARKGSKSAPKAKKAVSPKKVAAKKSAYKKTAQKVVVAGVPRTVYRKDGESYVRRKSSKTGKMYYSRLTKA